MGIGISGGPGPFRAGISTKGVSAGAGPVSVWGRHSGGAGCGALVLLLVGLLAMFLPYMFGDWLAGRFGAADGSTTRAVVGWIFEGAFLLLVLAGAIAMMVPSKEEKAAIAQTLEDARRAVERSQQSAELNQTVAQDAEYILPPTIVAPGRPEPLPGASAPSSPEAELPPDLPSDLVYGTGAERQLAKAWPGLHRHLHDGEVVRAAFRVNGTRPMVDLVVISSQRLLAMPVPTDKPPKVSTLLDTIKGITLSRMTDSIVLTHLDGTTTNIGYLKARADLDQFKTFVPPGGQP